VVEKEPDYESRQHDILQFVSKNPNCTKAAVIEHMLGRSAVTTTHAILKDMIQDGKNGKLNVYKKNLQTHLLTINEDNEFNKIYNFLALIEVLISKMRDNVAIIHAKMLTERSAIAESRAAAYSRPSRGRSFREFTEIEKLESLLIDSYEYAIDGILHRLLYIVSQKIHDEKDSRILYIKILDVLNKLTRQFSKIDQNRLYNNRINALRGVESLSSYAESLGVNVKLKDDVIHVIEHFMKEFLTETEQSRSKRYQKDK
jgi:hypothetical protein